MKNEHLQQLKAFETLANEHKQNLECAHSNNNEDDIFEWKMLFESAVSSYNDFIRSIAGEYGDTLQVELEKHGLPLLLDHE
ncbi:hypothetical protein C942_00483 [Photobacterium marinum]|uniref:Uncharacterized protein n=1 Tax=Photobacterium marinum TaxID=1056511 RepID=L8JB53_9GAMM|nr:hypothetical protein [Photobacterium marinum]ELR66041.1 hypothetical protein C942_00483 [Photobacterium marinum]